MTAPGLVNIEPAAKSAVHFVAPGLLLAVLPKCPACLAVFIATAASTGITAAAAARIQSLLAFLCVLWIAAGIWLLLSQLRRE